MTCRSDRKRVWGPRTDIPELPEVWVGRWIRLLRCLECETLWVASPFEPYASFPYLVVWDRTIEEFASVHAVDDGALCHEWLQAEIRVRMKTAELADIDASRRHDTRSGGHYGFDHFEEENPVDLSAYLKPSP
ncbi:hypothetical protein [Planctomycetes bacterium Pan216]